MRREKFARESPVSDASEPESPPDDAAAPPVEAEDRAADALRDRTHPLLGARAAYPLAFLSGLLYFLAFPGIDLWPLAFVALAPLIVALRGQRARRATALGWLAGFTMTMFGFYWLMEMLQTFSGFPWPLCLVFMALLCGYQAGRIGLLGWLSARAELRGWPPGPVFALAFAASELTFPLLFPWYYGATVHQVPALIQVAELGGPIAVALVLVAANLAVAELALARLEKRRLRWKVAGGLAAVPALAALYGAVRIPMVDAAVRAAPKARVGLVQANMSLLGKRSQKSEGLRRHVALTRELEEDGKLDLVVWSETSVMSAVDEAEVPLVYPLTFTRRLGVPAIFGGVIVREVSDARRYVLFNSALASDASGRIVGRYDKQFLLAFGEYLPFGGVFPKLYEWSPNSGKFTPGTSFAPLEVAGHEVGTFICYEDISPSFVNQIVRTGDPSLLVNITNDAWFGDTTEPWIHLALASFRAVEHRRYFVRSTNSGVSAFIDPVGRVVAHTPTFQEAALAHEIAWLRARTPYELWGDGPWWLVAAASFAGAFFRRRPPRPAKAQNIRYSE
ncbi:MAG: apolipoprotein N-acyltransferase [Sorangiineae bacterium]|nr:apolipoprotein N-acyltransferase [Polyangiaceae bacterium]MEB2324160.1 apolipoprotein N-acyltransferase [Sorangiineae bacterium]